MDGAPRFVLIYISRDAGPSTPLTPSTFVDGPLKRSAQDDTGLVLWFPARREQLLYSYQTQGGFAEAFAAGGEDGVGHGWAGDGDGCLAEAAGLRVAVDYGDLEGGRFLDAEGVVGAEVVLLDCAVANGDFFFEQ
jgi:hypothetical protein